jgi:hypothetical protein
LRARFESLVLSILSRWSIQCCLCSDHTSCIQEISSSFLITSLLILSSLVYPLTLLRKHISLLMSILFSLGGLPTHPQNPHSSRTSLSLLVWLLSYGVSGLGGRTRNVKFPPIGALFNAYRCSCSGEQSGGVEMSIIVQQDATIYSLLYFCKLF